MINKTGMMIGARYFLKCFLKVLNIFNVLQLSMFQVVSTSYSMSELALSVANWLRLLIGYTS